MLSMKLRADILPPGSDQDMSIQVEHRRYCAGQRREAFAQSLQFIDWDNISKFHTILSHRNAPPSIVRGTVIEVFRHWTARLSREWSDGVA